MTSEETAVAEAALHLAQLLHHRLTRKPISIDDNVADLAEAKGEYYYEIEPYKRWLLGDGGRSGNCELCIENADVGWIPADTDYPNADAPPAHPNCFPLGAVISASGVSRQFERWFAGELVIFRVSGLNDLAVTPNHPVLTQRGWLPASTIKITDRLLQCIDPAIFATIDPNNNYVESGIKQIARALLMTSGVNSYSVPSSSVAFHGDGSAYGKINTINATRVLRRNSASALGLTQTLEHRSFTLAHSQWFALPGYSPLRQLLNAPRHSSNRIMSRLGIGGVKLGRQVRGSHNCRILDSSEVQTKTAPSVSDGLSGNADAFRNVKDALAHKVREVQINEIGMRVFSGQVYNLETANGFYSCNSIITHNCTCSEEEKDRRVRYSYFDKD